jgi:hypothetical protein
MAAKEMWDWQVGVFCQNEASRIGQCITSIARAAQDRRVLATVILNGTTDDSQAAALRAAAECSLPLDVYRIAHADKSNAINRFFYDLRVEAGGYCCVDGYVTIGPEALSAFADCLATRREAKVVTGIPVNGRSMYKLSKRALEDGGIVFGNLYSLRTELIDRLIAKNIRLPLGLYRGDGLLGSLAAHDLDATGQPWKNRRVVAVREATFEIASLSLFNVRDLRRQLRRKVRHMRGQIENEAIKQIVYSQGYEALPRYSDDMIDAFLVDRGAPRTSLLDRPFMMLAIRQHRQAHPIDPASLLPVLFTSTR